MCDQRDMMMEDGGLEELANLGVIDDFGEKPTDAPKTSLATREGLFAACADIARPAPKPCRGCGVVFPANKLGFGYCKDCRDERND